MIASGKTPNGRKRREPLKPNGKIIHPECFYPRGAVCAVFGWKRDAWLKRRVEGLKILKRKGIEGCMGEDVIEFVKGESRIDINKPN